MSGFPLGLQQGGHNITGIFVRNNAPVSGQYANACPPGGLVLDIVAGVLYFNSGSIASPTFAVYGTVIPAGSVAPATINFAALPTSDPHVAGLLWVNSAVVTRSAG